MSYINFKEENEVARQQLERRKKNNENVYKYMVKHRDEDLVGYRPSPKYSYTTFNGQEFGKKGVLDEVDFHEIINEDMICTKFKDCNFKNVKFKDCRFVGCTFEDCTFADGGVVFENCILIKEDTEQSPSLNKKDNLSCSFYNCKMYVKFLNSDISYCIFENCNIKDTAFEQTFMKCTIIDKSELNMITIKDCDMSGFKMTNYYITNLDFNDDYKTKFDEKTYFDKIPIREKIKQEYEGVYMTYETLADKFKENTLNNNFGEYYYLAKCTERKSLKKPLPKLTSTIAWLTCGYGERPEFALFSGLAIIFTFAVIYMFTGVTIDKAKDIHYTLSSIGSLSLFEVIGDFNETLNLSVGMFGGIGVNNGQPSEISYMVSNFEMIIGIIMMGLGIGTLTRKIIR
ncbi:pentapeptide repeat-containing protein [Faecalimicrobium sp. JNUCC 81]